MEKMWLASVAPAVKFKNNLSVGANYIRPDIPPMFWGKCDLPLQKMPFKVDLNGIYFSSYPNKVTYHNCKYMVHF